MARKKASTSKARVRKLTRQVRGLLGRIEKATPAVKVKARRRRRSRKAA